MPYYRFLEWQNESGEVVATTPKIVLEVESNIVLTAVYLETVKGGCFVATAAYGSPLAKELNVIRRFRDACLPSRLIHVYYNVGPYLARVIKGKERLKRFVRVPLNVFVKLYRRKEKDVGN
jgi:hypothetical protein